MMSPSNPTHATLLTSLLILLSIISSFKLSFSIANTTINYCPEIEKHSLLIFKQSVDDPNGMLSSWDGRVNCCKWKGVICYRFTGHVLQLHLSNPANPSPKINPFVGILETGLKGNISSVSILSNLKHLTYLDLSGHQFLEGTIPYQIGSLESLQYLNLSYTGFHGKIPHTIGNLSNLHTLHLGSFHYDVYPSSLVADSLEWASGLSELEYLNMKGVNLRQATNWPQVITSLPYLIELHFEWCSLGFVAPVDDVINITTSLKHLYLSQYIFDDFLYQPTFIPQWIFRLTNILSLHLSGNFFIGPIPTISNFTKLQHIDLGWNFLNSSIPDWLYFCKDLESVDLGANQLSGAISNSIANLTSLQSLSVFMNQLSGKIPKEIANLCKIQSLVLPFNKFEGEISESFGNMSECFLENLETIVLSGNKISGHLTDQFGEFKILRNLILDDNSLLPGIIPISLWNLSSLEMIDLSDNKFSGSLPESLGQLVNLKSLGIANNMLEGVVTQAHFANLTKLITLDASHNNLTLKLSPNWNPPFQLRRLNLASWTLGSTIPSWLETQRLESLDLSDTGLFGSIPTWAWDIQLLSLSHNHLHGNLQLIPAHNNQSQYIYLDSNQFIGSLTLIPDTIVELDLSNNSISGDLSHLLCAHTSNLRILHLGRNQLSGKLPDCWMKWPELTYLNLGYNNLSGSIPNSIGYLANLESLNLPNNRLTGKMPFSMHNCTALKKIDLSNNDLDGDIPAWVGTSLIKLAYLILRSNKLSGNISSQICHLYSLQVLDLSDNKISGIIPRCFYYLAAMASKRSLYSPSIKNTLGHVKDDVLVTTKGSELLYESTLSLVTNIDLSRNNLSGDIPKELTSLVELTSLNLSHNCFTGSMPDHIGDMKLLESLDLSNNSLSGHIPPSITLLSFLSCLNLSYNNLTGEIPQSTQLRGMDASSFIGNNLCGPPLTIRCGGEILHGHEEEGDEEEGEGESKIEWLYVVLSLGYSVGVSAVYSLLVLNKSWRDAYFGFLQSLWDKLYVYVCIQWNKVSGGED